MTKNGVWGVGLDNMPHPIVHVVVYNTVGFTTNYTVATWVGNFDGEPMRQVSGVTGAAPLWNRISLKEGSSDHSSSATFAL